MNDGRRKEGRKHHDPSGNSSRHGQREEDRDTSIIAHNSFLSFRNNRSSLTAKKS
jgi:hypothetical protein